MREIKWYRLFIMIICSLIITVTFGVYYFINSDNAKILKQFNIKKLSHLYTTFTVEYEKVPAAKYYKIQVIDSYNNKMFTVETKKTKEEFDLENLRNGVEYSLMVYAYDELGDYRPANDDVTFIWDEVTFEDTSILLNDQDKTLDINGDMENQKYNIVVLKNGEEILKEKLDSNSFLLSNEYYLEEQTSLTVNILKDERIIDSIVLYNNINPITDPLITYPINNKTIPYGDFNLTYDGLDNVEERVVNIYNIEGKLVKEASLNKKNVVLSKSLFKANEFYTIEIVGKNGNFEKRASVVIKTSDQEYTLPVYINHNQKYVEAGTGIELRSDDDNPTIYYTLDGSDPNTSGIKYESPIIVSENVTIKAVAVTPLKHNSVVKTYDINVGKKENLIVYISPSNQGANEGVHEVGYTTEKAEMNDLSNYVIDRLKEYNVTVYRNNPQQGINEWNRDSNYLGADLHLAIHSNASEEHNVYGVETWINNDSSPTFSLASMIQAGLIDIYPHKHLPGYNRGVRYANGALGEVNDEYVNNGILVEIAHHDYYDDAKWMMEEKEKIGKNIADTILRYYGYLE